MKHLVIKPGLFKFFKSIYQILIQNLFATGMSLRQQIIKTPGLISNKHKVLSILFKMQFTIFLRFIIVFLNII